jgi:hypothetical protein
MAGRHSLAGGVAPACQPTLFGGLRPLCPPYRRPRGRPARVLPDGPSGDAEHTRREFILQASSIAQQLPPAVQASCFGYNDWLVMVLQAVNFAILGDLVGTGDARTVVNSILGKGGAAAFGLAHTLPDEASFGQGRNLHPSLLLDASSLSLLLPPAFRMPAALALSSCLSAATAWRLQIGNLICFLTSSGAYGLPQLKASRGFKLYDEFEADYIFEYPTSWVSRPNSQRAGIYISDFNVGWTASSA